MANSLKVNIAPGISIITIGSLGILIASFVKSYGINADTSLFSLSAFCLILSGILVIYRESVVKRYRIFRRQKSLFDIESRRFPGLLNLISNTLFDFGIIILLFGVGKLLLNEFESSTFINNNLSIIIFIIIVIFLINLFSRRHFIS